MRFVSPAPDQTDGEWLVVDDPDNEISDRVTCGMQIEGDIYHLGWSSKVTTDPGVILPLPEVERLMVEVARAITEAIDAFEFDIP